ncbi:hypothetical protein BDY24DRAFT_411439 [Mrakia frigida]|uniref:E3 ubiquitin-protein ligase n=1 Tax=Mrakia frigida TaxID=29902 RepID=UPI003FCBF77D
MPEVWFCHQCEAQIDPRNVDGLNICPNCGSDFLESVNADDPPSPPLGQDPRDFGLQYEDLDDNDEDPTYDLPGSFPSQPPPQAHPYPSTPSSSSSSRHRPASGPIFRFGMGGGSITIGGGSGGSGRRAGYGAEQGSPGPLRTSHMEGVPTLADFLASSMDPVRARSHNNNNNNYPPSLGGPSRSNTVPGRNEVPGGDLMDIMNNLLGILSEGNPRGGRLGAADDPYLQMLRSQGGLGALFGGAGGAGRGSFGDYATSQEAFDRIVTQLAQAAGPSADRPPPATSSMIHSLPSIPIDSILLSGLDQKECTICMSDFEAGEQGKKMPCTHLFHQHCLETWLETNGTCPVCRFSLLTMSATEVSTNGGAHQDPSTSTSFPAHEAGSATAPTASPSSSSPTEQSTGESSSISGRRGSDVPLVRRNGAAAGTGVRGREGEREREEGWGEGGAMDLD